MGSPVRPEPDNWLLDDLRRRVQPEPRQLGPQSPFAPADASAVRQRPVPKTLADYGHTAKQILGGVVEGATRLPTDMLGLLTTPLTAGPEQGSLQTVGRGEVRPSAQPSMASVVQPQVQGLLHTGEDVARRAGDAAAGGAPESVSDESFRQIGDLAGNVAAWEVGARLPKMLRGLRAAEAVAPRGPRPAIPDYEPFPAPIADAHPLELPPEGLSFEEQQAWRRRMVARRMGKPEGTGEARGYANASGQELLDNHLRQQGLGRYVDRSRGGLLDMLPTLDERGAVGARAPERVVAAATRAEDGRIFTGVTHGESGERAAEAGALIDGDPNWYARQGFVTNTGRFLTREEAGNFLKTQGVVVPTFDSKFLTSEDIGKTLSREAATTPSVFDNVRGLLSDESGRIGVFHGSPHKFPPEPEHPLGRFDISKIGTGEGAQAYGHGLYFAGDENVAQYYRAKETGTLFPPKPSQFTLDGVAYERRGNQFLRGNGEKLTKKEYGTAFQNAQTAYDDAVANRGALYRAEIDAEPEHFLDWDKPLSEQSAYVRERLTPILRARLEKANLLPEGGARQDLFQPALEAFMGREGTTGDALYRLFQEMHGSPDAASRALRDLGIPGNRYLDGSSRAAGQGSHNYVVFSDEPIKITGREGQGALPVLGALGLLSGGALTVAAKKGLLDH